MDAAELRQRRKAVKLTQAELGARLGLHRDFVGLMERGVQPIAERTALAVTALSPGAPSTEVRPARPLPALTTTDPMEQMIERALLVVGEPFLVDRNGAIPEHLDFYLPDRGVFIEVKQFHSDRVAAQMARADNVIVAQGKAGVQLLAAAIERGLLPNRVGA